MHESCFVIMLESTPINRFSKEVKIGEGKLPITDAVNASGCVDPRKSREVNGGEIYGDGSIFIHRTIHEHNAVRSPGASLGYVMILLAAKPDLSIEQAVDLVDKFENIRGRKFTYHQDTHNKKGLKGGEGLGCGHIDKAIKYPELYGLKKDRAEEMVKYVDQKIEKEEMTANVPVLEGDHRESGVLVIITDKNNPKTVVPIDDKGNEYFRYDKTLHEEEIKKLANFACQNKIKVTGDELLESAKMQIDATLSLLAEGKPMSQIDLTGEEAKVTPMGMVPPPPQRA